MVPSNNGRSPRPVRPLSRHAVRGGGSSCIHLKREARSKVTAVSSLDGTSPGFDAHLALGYTPLRLGRSSYLPHCSRTATAVKCGKQHAGSWCVFPPLCTSWTTWLKVGTDSTLAKNLAAFGGTGTKNVPEWTRLGLHFRETDLLSTLPAQSTFSLLSAGVVGAANFLS